MKTENTLWAGECSYCDLPGYIAVIDMILLQSEQPAIILQQLLEEGGQDGQGMEWMNMILICCETALPLMIYVGSLFIITDYYYHHH